MDQLSPVERMWAVRDAILQWLYINKAEGIEFLNPSPEAVMAAVGWKAGPLTQDEVDAAAGYLQQEELISGTGVWGGGVLKARITPQGERFADREVSVRKSLEDAVPAHPQGVVINNHAPANFSVNSSNVTQSLEISNQVVERANALADALDGAAGSESVDESEVRGLAAEIREEAGSGSPDAGRLRGFAGRAIGAVAASAGGTAVIEAATTLLPLLV